jgi:hypothetical protein
MIENHLFERSPPNHYLLAQVYHLSSTTKKYQDWIRKKQKEKKYSLRFYIQANFNFLNSLKK